MEEKHEVKGRIQEKAEELFMQYGIRSVSMDDIAAQLGMSKKTLYHYFNDKDKLVDDVVDAELEKGRCECAACLQYSKNAVEEIFFTMEHIANQFRQMNPVLLFDLEKFHPASFQKFLKHKNEYLLEIVQKNIERGIAEELFRPEINADIISRFRIESIMIAFNLTAFPPKKYSLLEVTQEIIDHYLFGLATIKGHKLILKYKEQRKKVQHENRN
ncbi:MAG: TetR/AcrR family transcriptional regulator [Chitinophagaceae bacterium]|jgi:AcrR family transcriptional regulator